MCTGIAMKTRELYFGRNMDLEYSFNEKIAVTPRNYPLVFKKAEVQDRHAAIIGMASVVNGYPLYADAANEYGLCIAGLNFPDNAYYSPEILPDKINIAPYELPLFILGQCATVDEAVKLLERSNIADIPFSDKIPCATLHWLISDKKRSVTLECVKSGMKIYDNRVNVLANNPTFDFHETNLGNYLNLSAANTQNVFSEKAGVKPFGKGLGSVGLPGDPSSPSRFVKAAFMLLNSKCPDTEEGSVMQFFHILDSVSVVNGSIALDSGEDYYTRYSCCINADRGVYYYKTYGCGRVCAVNMNNENLDSNTVITFEKYGGSGIKYLN